VADFSIVKYEDVLDPTPDRDERIAYPDQVASCLRL
jgi:hypothetical protein